MGKSIEQLAVALMLICGIALAAGTLWFDLGGRDMWAEMMRHEHVAVRHR